MDREQMVVKPEDPSTDRTFVEHDWVMPDWFGWAIAGIMLAPVLILAVAVVMA